MAAQRISFNNGTLNVPDQVVIPFIEGDGTGVDIWASSVRVFDAAVEKAYGGTKKLNGRKFWQEKKHLNKQIVGCLRKHWTSFPNAKLP